MCDSSKNTPPTPTPSALERYSFSLILSSFTYLIHFFCPAYPLSVHRPPPPPILLHFHTKPRLGFLSADLSVLYRSQSEVRAEVQAVLCSAL